MSYTVPPTVGDYLILNNIGTGGYGSVYKAKHKVTNSLCAIKVFPKKTHNYNLEKEFNLVKSIYHPFIIQVFEIIEDDCNYYVSMEYVDNGTLRDFINNNKIIREPQIKKIMIQLVIALEYLHNRKQIVHRDLKADNILLDKYSNIKIIDFGFASPMGNDNLMSTACGSPNYIAPEIWKKIPYTSKVDIWSAGVILYTLSTGYLPFHSDNVTKLMNDIVEKKPEIPQNISIEQKELIEMMLEKDPGQRITLESIRSHKWIMSSEDYKMFNIIKDFLEREESFIINEQINNKLGMMRISPDGVIEDMKNNLDSNRVIVYKMIRRQLSSNELHYCIDPVLCMVPPGTIVMKTSSRSVSMLAVNNGKKKSSSAQRVRKNQPVLITPQLSKKSFIPKFGSLRCSHHKSSSTTGNFNI